MHASALSILIITVMLGCALVAGVFFAFSSFVMKALSRLPPDEGIFAMQRINEFALQTSFLAVFLGTAAGSVALPLLSLTNSTPHPRLFLLLSCATYFIGTFLVTIVFNVPLNNSLAKLTNTTPDRQEQWVHYQVSWTAWNHVRTATSLIATCLLALAI